MEMQQLKGFLAMARLLSFSKAAKETFRTQPAISLQIQALEAELDAQLFSRRGGGKVELTDAGKALLEIASPLVQDFDSVKARFDEKSKGELKGPLRIATHSSAMMYMLPDVIKKFKKKYPGCELSVLNRGRQDIVAMLENGEIDLGISSFTENAKTIDYTALARFKRMLITPADSPLSKKTKITLKDIAKYPLLLPPKGSNTRQVVETALAGEELSYSIAMETTGKFAIKPYVEMGLGISIVNEFYMTEADKTTLFMADMSKYFGYAERGVLTRKNRPLSRAAEEFKRILLEKYKTGH